MNSSRRDWLRSMLTESEKVAIEPEVARLMTSADKNRGHFVQTNRLL